MAVHYIETMAFRQSLAETISWCARHPVYESVGDSPEFKEHRVIRDRVEQLFQKSHKRAWRNWFRRNAAGTPERAGALRLLERDSGLGMFGRPLLRSPELRPQKDLDGAEDEKQRAGIVEQVIETRASCLRSSGVLIAEAEEVELAGGRLLLYFPLENLADGAAEVASAGVLDLNNTPPWDTWVGFSQETLVSWIPAWLVPLVQDGVAVNPEECIRWAE